ncbi:MBL fold metallo-hydrolase [Desulfotruncus alcoholivorax]|uniref:MBL fold metallo-hydrolase n=1 Tax=Desulfotruncus alcoholivorax TaxID=265477 RepID=UPI00040BDF5A|nr:MBL fold metallo-hydrolase [Desulfotruncus alcoholivorax]
MILKALVVGMLGTNCYIIGCEKTGIGAVVDPGAESERVLDELKKLNLNCRYIILTHGHMDHIGDVGEVRAATGALVLIHAADAGRLVNPGRFSALPVGEIKPGNADRTLQHGDEIEVGTIKIKVIHTPGHTPGGICLDIGNILITGDTLFAESIGRTDFPGGSYTDLINSIKERLLVFPDETGVYPGHGPSSTIGNERRFNPFLQ